MADIRPRTTDSRELLVVGECREVYHLLYDILKSRKDYYLWQHCLKSLVSVGSNIAEGNKRGKKEQLRFMDFADGSMAEFEFQYSLLKIDSTEIPDKVDKIKAMMYKLRMSVVGSRRSD